MAIGAAPSSKFPGTLVPRRLFRRLLIDAGPDLGRQRIRDFLLEMSHETDRAGHDGQPAADLPGDLELARDRADGAGGVDRKGPLSGPSGCRRNPLDQVDMAARKPVFGRHGEEPRNAWIHSFVSRMSEPGDDAALGDDAAGGFVEILS